MFMKEKEEKSLIIISLLYSLRLINQSRKNPALTDGLLFYSTEYIIRPSSENVNLVETLDDRD